MNKQLLSEQLQEFAFEEFARKVQMDEMVNEPDEKWGFVNVERTVMTATFRAWRDELIGVSAKIAELERKWDEAIQRAADVEIAAREKIDKLKKEKNEVLAIVAEMERHADIWLNEDGALEKQIREWGGPIHHGVQARVFDWAKRLRAALEGKEP